MERIDLGRLRSFRFMMRRGLVFLLFLFLSTITVSSWAGDESLRKAESSEEVRPAASDAPPSSSLTIPAMPDGFSSYDGGWLKVAYHPSLAARVRVLTKQADSVRAELTELLGQPVLSKVVVRVGRTAGEMELLAPKNSRFPRYASGVAYSEIGLVLLTATSRYPGEQHDLPQVFRHELAHIALHNAVGRDNIPRWFNEGFAVHASGEAVTSRLSALSTASLSGNLLPFAQLRDRFPADAQTASVAYAQAADLIRFLLRRGEEHRFSSLIERIRDGQSFERALQDAYSVDMYLLERQWREDVARRYTFWPVIFGGSMIWAFGLGLLAWGYTRRKKRAREKLARWAKEEALEDARRHWAQVVMKRAQAAVEEAEHGPTAMQQKDQPREERAIIVITRPVPSVEHKGERHTLH